MSAYDLLILAVGLAISVGMQGAFVGGLFSFLITVDPALLPRPLALLQAKPGDPGNGRPARWQSWLLDLLLVGLIAYLQYIELRYFLLFPTWALAYGPMRFFWIGLNELALLAWAVYAYRTLRRAQSRSSESDQNRTR